MTDQALTHIDDAPMARDLVPTDRRLLPAPMEQLQEIGALIQSAGALVPDALRKDIGACTAVAYMSALHGTDPIATASQVYIISGKLAFMAQYISALIRKHVDCPPSITFSGEGPQRFCHVVLTMKGVKLEYTSPRVAVITPKNSPLWKSDPDQQLSYYSIRAAARRHMPQVLLGIYSVEEMQSVQIKDVTPVAPDPFSADEDEIEHVEAEEVDTEPTPSGGETYDTSEKPQRQVQEDQKQKPATQRPQTDQWPPHDDPMAFFEVAKIAVADAADTKALNRLWSATEANRFALKAADPISAEELDGAFTARGKELAGQ